jgi:hypothetical protein
MPQARLFRHLEVGSESTLFEYCVEGLHVAEIHDDGCMSVIGAPTGEVIPCDGSCASHTIIEEQEMTLEQIERLRALSGIGQTFIIY